VNTFEIDDYKKILKQIIAEKRKVQKGLSRRISEYAGIHPTFVSQVLSGNKDFSEEQLLLVCEFLGIKKLETKYLLTLLLIDRAGSIKLKQHYIEIRDQIRAHSLRVDQRIPKHRKLSEVEKAIFYSSWIYSAVHMLTTLETSMSFEKICSRLTEPHAKIREVLDFLISANLVKEEKGYFVATTLATHIDKQSPFLVRHHANWRLRALQAAENLAETELMYTANFSVSRKDFAQLREMMMQTIQQSYAVIKDSPAEDVAQMNLDFFWIR
jgi:uncharacterized protein (TIGR02147 family)